ncbi:MAG: Leucyl-tRNA synthetase [Candidatus Nomurabacteria bacterium GW2011_GWA2_40_9]|uniref:leucine--tRNA ligase n=1 Tax=Candidatus Nomurabacteria bacterium GW2011_GWA2_40_9 TaxID=1618734 RepID=A0A0G0WWK7_9BACT|nr:MAG: Leucyl-tRNA synthetase [Candidatus Nomurabacteria bacterium GW2011_GWA2_40_9]
MKEYNHLKIEKKWQKEWHKKNTYKTLDKTEKKKMYVLDMFPYPSGEGLHVGHPRGYIGTDVYSRFKRMNNFNVLHPMGFDAFGLPAEQYALKNKIHPEIAVKKNVKRFKEQLSIMGVDYDWSREVNTTDSEYYKWTQWIFLQMYKKGLAYESYEPINWCPVDKTGLANEDIEDGKCERCGATVEKRPMRQWVLAITKYADRLIKDLDGLDWSDSVKESQRNWIGKSVNEKGETVYKLRDWVFSRQRYWGEPIPIIHCDSCGVVPVREEDLPVVLPKVKNYEPTDTGESPLATISKWVNTKCPNCKGRAKRETNTMPSWAGSSWYYLRYEDPKNKKALVDLKREKYWSPVDLYVGGMEHATRHLIYARFWHKFLYDIKVVNYSEPFSRLVNQGLIMATDGRKMSKRWGNVINPDDIIKTYGADTLRLYEMFIGPFDQVANWSTDSIIGPRRFLEKVWKIGQKILINKISAGFTLPGLPGGSYTDQKFHLSKFLHKTIKKVTEDIEGMHFNTAVSSMMILASEMESAFARGSGVTEQDYKKFLQLLSPFAPHIAEELWQKLLIPQSLALGSLTKSIHLSSWPVWDEGLIKEEKLKIMIQVNGKVRSEMLVDTETGEEEIEKLALSNEVVIKLLEARDIKKIIYVKGRLINIVI